MFLIFDDLHFFGDVLNMSCLFLENEYLYVTRPSSGGAVLLAKLVDGRCQVQSPVVLVSLVVRSFPWFSPKLA